MTIKQRPEKLAPQRRSITLRLEPGAPGQRALVDKDTRSVRLSFSSEEPVDMWYGTEILSHAKGAVRLNGDRQASMPLLFNHNRDDLLGIVESIEIGQDKRGYATVRFGKDERGDWAMQQADDGILCNVSFMYRVFKFEEDTEAETYTATDWEPYEISLVTIPADATVGVGRAAGDEERDVQIQARTTTQPATAEPKEGTTMKRKFVLQDAATDGASGSAGGAPAIDVTRERAVAATDERARIAEIDAMCKQHKIEDEVRRGFVQKGATVAEVRGSVLDILSTRGAQKPAVDLGAAAGAVDMSSGEKARYSMIRALNAAISNNWKEAGLELEVSNDIAKRSGKSSQGFFVPTNIDYAMRAAYSTGAPTTGGALVATNLLAGSFIELLRKKARVLQMGATVLSGLVGNVDIPRQTGAATAYWVAEGSDLTESEMTFDKVSLTQKSVGTYGMISRNMMMQSTPDIEMLVRADLLAIIALGIDLAALSGTGTNGQPLGIANTSNIGSVLGGTNGAAITIDHLIDLETAVTSANVDEANLAYLSNAKVVGALKKLKSTTGAYLWTNLPGGNRSGTPGEINGYSMARTNQARSNLTKGNQSGVASEVFFGDFSQVLLGEWGVLEILPNPYDSTAYKQGGVLIRAMQSVDVAIRHPQAFAVMSDALTA